MPSNNIYEFGEFRLDCQNLVLIRADEEIKLQPRVFDTLMYLVEHAGTMVTKEDLIREVWGTEVQDSSLMRCVSLVRTALDDVEGNNYIRTVPGYGYEFCAPVKTLLASAGDDKVIAPVIPLVTAAASSSRPGLVGYWWAAVACLSALLAVVVGNRFHQSPPSSFKAIQLTTNSKEFPISTASISPDGKMIAFADQTGLIITDINTVERHTLPLPKELLPSCIEWFPDSLHLLVSTNNPTTHQSTVWVFSVLGGSPTLLIKNATKAVVSLDGLRVAFIRNDTELWLANIDGSSPTLFETARPNEMFPFRPQFLKDGRSIIFGSTSLRFDHASIAIRHFDDNMTILLFKTDKVVVDFRLMGNDNLIVSWQPNLLDRGTHLISQKVNLDTGMLSSPLELPTLPNYVTTNISLTGDDNIIAVINSRLLEDVYLGDLQENGTALSNSRRLTKNDSLNAPTDWLADNRTVLFQSDRSGHYDIYYQAIDSVDAHAIVNDEHDNIRPIVSADQRWLFYLSLDSRNSASTLKAHLMRRPLAGGKSIVADEQVVDIKDSLRCASTVNRCILVTHADDKAIYFEFDPEKGRGRELARTLWKPANSSYSWDLCADGTRIAFIDVEKSTDAIGIITLNDQSATISHLHVIGQEALRTLTWDAAGNGFYVSTYNDDQDELKLLHIAIDGSVNVLRQQLTSFDGWAIPSSDGKHLAFHKYTTHSNIWLLQRQ